MLSLLFLRIHTAQTRIAQLQPHFPAAARYRLHQLFQKMVQRTFLIRRQQTLAVDMFLDQMADTRIFAWFDRRKSAGEFCIGCCCFPAKTGIYAPQTKILVNSCFRSSDPPARPLLLLFLFRRSKQMIRAASAAITSSVSRIRSTPSSPRRNSETLRSTGRTASPALLFRFSTPVICSADSELFSSITFFWTESGLPTIF